MSRTIRIATRGSKLAQIQARKVGETLVAENPDFSYELVLITTQGDRFMGDLSKIGGKGVFVKEVESALMANEADVAVHSVKDMPPDSEQPEALKVVAMLEREDIRDVTVCRPDESFVSLKEGQFIGTSSVRRTSQVRATFPHLGVKPIRGNVETRIQKLLNGDVDALVLAKAGLDRLGLEGRISEVLEPDMMCPAVGQGAIAAQCRADDAALIAALENINHQDTWTCVQAERAMLAVLSGSCHTPIAGFCEVTKGGSLRLIGLVANMDGSEVLRTRHKMPYDDPIALGQAAGNDLKAQGAEAIIQKIVEEVA